MNIGDLALKNNVFLAPMAGITNLPFRIIAREFGCALAFTEMVSAHGLVRRTGKSCRFLCSSPQDKPLGVQIFGSDPGVLSEAAKVAADYGADLLDINMGCPVKKVVKTGAGAALLKNPGQVCLILQAVRKAISLPFTVKIRSGWHRSTINALEIARIAGDCGVNAIIIHPRTADQGFSGTADWRIIEALKKDLCIPVIGSGDIRNPGDAQRMIASTGCDGVAVGRGALGNPWIFRDIINCLGGQDSFIPLHHTERERIVKRHMEMEIDYWGERLGLINFRKHLLWYTKTIRGGSVFREFVGRVRDKNAILNELHRFFLSVAAEGAEGPNSDEIRT